MENGLIKSSATESDKGNHSIESCGGAGERNPYGAIGPNGMPVNTPQGKGYDPLRTLTSCPLSIGFYERDTVQVAQDLLGKILVVCSSSPSSAPLTSIVTAGRIVETEAYQGDDPAAHSARGETPRSSVMFGSPGIAYVYLIYGMYEMLNFVTEKRGTPGAVLIRAVEPILGEDIMESRRIGKLGKGKLTQGPGRLCRAMGIQMSHNRQSLQGPSLYVCSDGFRPDSISKSPRVGIRVGTDRLWRFFLTRNGFVSRAPQNNESVLV